MPNNQIPDKTSHVDSYVAGFALSIVLTLTAYTMVRGGLVENTGKLVLSLMLLALAQLAVQLKFFLHLNLKEEGRYNMFFLVSAIAVILIVVVGSLWIMSHLNYNMVPESFIIKDEGMKMR